MPNQYMAKNFEKTHLGEKAKKERVPGREGGPQLLVEERHASATGGKKRSRFHYKQKKGDKGFGQAKKQNVNPYCTCYRTKISNL